MPNDNDTPDGIDYGKLTIGALCASMADVRNEIFLLSAQKSKLEEIQQRIKWAMIRYGRENDVLKFGNEKITVTVKDKPVVKYEPAKFESILAWLVATQNTHCIQRRFTVARVVDLATGSEPLPDGLSLDTIDDISITTKR